MSEKQKIDRAIDAFAAEMKKRMHEKRREGFKGWAGDLHRFNCNERMMAKAYCATTGQDSQDCIDAANFLMMIWNDSTTRASKAAKGSK